MEKNIEQWIADREYVVRTFGLEKMDYLMELLGNPQFEYPVIHVTGTNGKGSTIAFLEQLFAEHGYKAGVYVSPHLISYHDRIRVGKSYIPVADFERIAKRVQEAEVKVIEKYEILTYFEILTAIMFVYFAEVKVDVALVEVGIGGLMDVTNIVRPTVTSITSIGLDHQALLGETITEIAIQKTGIFKPNSIAVVGPLDEEATEVAIKKAEEVGATLYRYGHDFQLDVQKEFFGVPNIRLQQVELGLYGKFQYENASVALQSFYSFMEYHQLQVDEKKVYAALKNTRWAGRMEKVNEDPIIYLDGAHNVHAIHRLIENITSDDFKDKKCTILFGALKKKDYSEMLALLHELAPEIPVVVTSFVTGEAATREDVESSLSLSNISYEADYREFLAIWKKENHEEKALFITGSLYFIAEMREYLLENKTR